MLIPIEKIVPDANQPRKTFDEEAIKGLANSFESYGIISPLKVRPCGDSQYMIIVGEMRWRAAKEKGEKEVDCTVQEAIDQQAREMQFIENLDRTDIPDEELGRSFISYCQQYKCTMAELGRRIGKGRQFIEDRVAIITKLSPTLHKEGAKPLTFTEKREIASIPSFKRQEEVAQPFIDGKINSTHIQKVCEIARKEPERPVEDIIDAVISGKAKVEEIARLEVAKKVAGITIETPEELARAADALREEAKRRAETLLTPEERAAREAEAQARAENGRRREEERQRRKEEERRRLEEEVKEELLRDPTLILRAKAMEVRSKRLKEREAERAKGLEIGAKASDALDSRLVLMKASIEEVATTVEESSVDVIITDPPYSKEYLDCFSSLAHFAFKALKPGKSLLVMVGQSYLPEVFRLLCEQMSYHWILAYLTPGGQSPQIWPRKINTFWKPVIWLTKGKYEGEDWHGDVFNSDVNDNDKRFHHWGQSESGVSRLVEAFSKPDDVVCDPFLGGGTTAVVAIRLGRKFIGYDIDESVLETCRRRVVQSYE